MTRAQANEVLTLWKAGAQHYPSSVITLALYLTGDIQ